MLVTQNFTKVGIMRRFLLFLVFIVVVFGILWQLNLIKLPTISFSRFSQQPQVQEVDLFTPVFGNDITSLTQKISEGANVNAINDAGQTPLMVASGIAGDTAMLNTLIKAGADVNAKTPEGWTALMYAVKDTQNLAVPYLLLNAGADPTAKTNDGQSITDVAGIPVRASPLFRNLQNWSTLPFDPSWPIGYIVPVEGATISSRTSHLPGAPRAYRNGTHEGFDFYSGVVSVQITYGTPIRSVASGTVIRAAHDYVEMTTEEYDQVIAASINSPITPEELLDKLRGRQVWIEHAGGFVSRYAHLSNIPEGIVVGVQVAQGQVIGGTGNSGTLEAVNGSQDGPHPHVEIWKGTETYLGKGLEPDVIYNLTAQVFGEKALPPFRE